MDSCGSWSPSSLSAEAFPALDLVFSSSLHEPTGGLLCAKEESCDDKGNAFSSSCLSNEAFPRHSSSTISSSFGAVSSHVVASPQSLNSGIHDSRSDTTKLAQEEAFSLPSPTQSADGSSGVHVKRARLDQSVAAASKTHLSQNPVPRLGEKINLLQQLVSPFGKPDTASVLLETIGYIKFLQDQVHVLSSAYTKGNLTKKEGSGAGCLDLQSRGLCLVPISCTMNISNSNGADYWISGISGCGR